MISVVRRKTSDEGGGQWQKQHVNQRRKDVVVKKQIRQWLNNR